MDQCRVVVDPIWNQGGFVVHSYCKIAHSVPIRRQYRDCRFRLIPEARRECVQQKEIVLARHAQGIFSWQEPYVLTLPVQRCAASQAASSAKRPAFPLPASCSTGTRASCFPIKLSPRGSRPAP